MATETATQTNGYQQRPFILKGLAIKKTILYEVGLHIQAADLTFTQWVSLTNYLTTEGGIIQWLIVLISNTDYNQSLANKGFQR